MKHHKQEKGQALIIIAFALIGLIAMTGLAIDTGTAYIDRRQSQNAADSAALAAALAVVRGENMQNAALNRALSNGFDNNGTTNTITVNHPPQKECDGVTDSPYINDNNYVQVIIRSTTDTSFSSLVGVDEVDNCVEAVARATPPTVVPLFDGNAVVGLNPRPSSQGSYPCGFDSGNSNAVKWHLTGGGIFSNGCAYAKNFNSVNLDEDAGGNPTKCATAVHAASGFKCMQTGADQYSTTDIANLMPPAPACDNTAAGGYVVPSSPSSFTFNDGIYCVSNFDAFRQQDIVLNNATLYVTDMTFDVKFAGHGGFAGTASTAGPYKGYFLIVAMNSTPCERYQSGPQSIEFRGNGTSDVVGTFMAPTACIDFRGNSNGNHTRSQVVGYTVSSNGNADLYINYNAGDNAQTPKPPEIMLAK
ncbi:MAG: hypothetical protein Kow002_15820 [Anaerolineales bacterium]